MMSVVSDSSSGTPMQRRKLFILVGAAAAVVFTVLAVRYVNWPDVREALSKAHVFPWVPLGALAYASGVVLRGWRLKRLVSHETRISLFTASNVVAIGYATNNVLPGRLGEFARARALQQQTSLGFAESFTVTVLERVLDGLVMLFLFAAVAGLSTAGFLESTLASRLVSGIAIALFASFTVVIAFATLSPHNFTRGVSGILGRVRSSWHAPAYVLCLYIANGVAYLRRPSGAAQVFALSVAIWLVEGLMFLCVLIAFSLPADFGLSLLAMTVTNLGIAIPSTPGYVGSWHFFCGETLRLSGVNESIALSYAIVTHLTFYIPITIWGGAVLLAYGSRLRMAADRTIPETTDEPIRFAHLAALPAAGEHKNLSAAARFYGALVETLIPAVGPPLDDAEASRSRAHVLQFVFDQLNCLPNRVFVLYTIGIAGFRAVTWLRYLRPFQSLPLETRRRWVSTWADGPIALTRKLFRPVRSFVLLSFYEYPPVRAAIASGDHSGHATERSG